MVLSRGLDQNTEMAYVLPIASTPWVFAHSKEVRIGENPVKRRMVDVSDIFWK